MHAAMPGTVGIQATQITWHRQGKQSILRTQCLLLEGVRTPCRNVRRLPGKGDTQERRQEGRQDLDKRGTIWQTAHGPIWEEVGEEVQKLA